MKCAASDGRHCPNIVFREDDVSTIAAPPDGRRDVRWYSPAGEPAILLTATARYCVPFASLMTRLPATQAEHVDWDRGLLRLIRPIL